MGLSVGTMIAGWDETVNDQFLINLFHLAVMVAIYHYKSCIYMLFIGAWSVLRGQ